MNQELVKYLDELFAQAPKTKASYELKEELLANANERYIDLIAENIPEKEAVEIVIHSIGDVEQLFPQVDQPKAEDSFKESTVKKVALYRSIAIGLYIFGLIMAVVMDEFLHIGSLSAVTMLLMAALATCILVYVGTAYPKYKRGEDTVVEEFKEWNHNQKKKKTIKSSVITIVWMVTLILYFLISFFTMAWYITWVIFLIGICAQAIVTLLFQLRDTE